MEEEFPLQKLPNELLARFCELSTFKDFSSITSSCHQLKNLASRNLRVMPKKEVQYLTIRCDSSCVEVSVDGIKNLSVNSYDAFGSYLCNLKITKCLFFDNFTPTFLNHIPTKILLQDVQILELSNTLEATPVRDIVPLMKLLPKCNQLKFTDSCKIYGKLSSLLEHMDYCHSLCFTLASHIKFDDDCLKIISSKSSPSKPLLLVFAVYLPSSISLSALKNFLYTTHFCSYSLITFSQMFATRHEIIIEFFSSIQMHNDDPGNDVYDFEASIVVPDGNIVRLKILKLLEPPPLEEQE